MAPTSNSDVETVALIIDGRPVSKASRTTSPVYSLEEQRGVHYAESADVDVARNAADASWKTFRSWKKSSGVTRRNLFLRYAQLLRDHEKDLVAVQRLETSVIEM